VIFTLTLERSTASTEATSGLLCTAIVGGAFLPLLVGALSDHAGYVTALTAPAACYALLCLVAVSAGRAPVFARTETAAFHCWPVGIPLLWTRAAQQAVGHREPRRTGGRARAGAGSSDPGKPSQAAAAETRRHGRADRAGGLQRRPGADRQGQVHHRGHGAGAARRTAR